MQPGLSANFSRRVCSFPLGKALGGPAPTARAVGWVRVDAALRLFEIPSPPFVKGGLCSQGVRLEVFQRAYPGSPFGGRQGNVRFPPPQHPLPSPCTTPTPRRPIVVKSRSHKQARSMLRCQLPKARGRLLTGQFPQLQKQVYPSASTSTPSRVTCVWFKLTGLTLFCLQMD
jgi:hypothetical protein